MDPVGKGQPLRQDVYEFCDPCARLFRSAGTLGVRAAVMDPMWCHEKTHSCYTLLTYLDLFKVFVAVYQGNSPLNSPPRFGEYYVCNIFSNR